MQHLLVHTLKVSNDVGAQMDEYADWSWAAGAELGVISTFNIVLNICCIKMWIDIALVGLGEAQ